MGKFRYSDESRAEAVSQVGERGYSVKEVPERIDVSTRSPYKWFKVDPMGTILTTEEYADAVKRAVADGCDAIKADFFPFRESGELDGFSDKDRTCMLIPQVSVFHRYQLEERIGFYEKQVCLPPCTSKESAG